MSEVVNIEKILERENVLFEQVMGIKLPTSETDVNARPVILNRAIMQIKTLLLMVVECQAVIIDHIRRCEESVLVDKVEKTDGNGGEPAEN